MAKRSRMEHGLTTVLDAWADQVVGLENGVAEEVAAYSKRLAANLKLSKRDRDFAAAQVDALKRAAKRLTARRRAVTESKNK